MHGITPDTPGWQQGSKAKRPWAGFGITAVLAIFGTMLVVQSDRWYKTPAYGNLLHIMTADTWGYVYLGIATLMCFGLIFWGSRRVNVATHTLAFVVLAAWEVGFIIRYLTDQSTTIVNVVSWGTYIFLVVSSALAIDRKV